MRICKDPVILREDRGILFSCRGNDNLIGGILVERWGEDGGSVRNPRRERGKSQPRHSESLLNPLLGIAGNAQPALLDQLRELPRRYCGEKQLVTLPLPADQPPHPRREPAGVQGQTLNYKIRIVVPRASAWRVTLILYFKV